MNMQPKVLKVKLKSTQLWLWLHKPSWLVMMLLWFFIMVISLRT